MLRLGLLLGVIAAALTIPVRAHAGERLLPELSDAFQLDADLVAPSDVPGFRLAGPGLTGRSPFPLSAGAVPTESGQSRGLRVTLYTLGGLLVGGAAGLFGSFFFFIASGMGCRDGLCALYVIPFAALAALVGGVVGAIIAWPTPAGPPSRMNDNDPRDADPWPD